MSMRERKVKVKLDWTMRIRQRTYGPGEVVMRVSDARALNLITESTFRRLSAPAKGPRKASKSDSRVLEGRKRSRASHAKSHTPSDA